VVIHNKIGCKASITLRLAAARGPASGYRWSPERRKQVRPAAIFLHLSYITFCGSTTGTIIKNTGFTLLFLRLRDFLLVDILFLAFLRIIDLLWDFALRATNAVRALDCVRVGTRWRVSFEG
jgi:hypothetical protein